MVDGETTLNAGSQQKWSFKGAITGSGTINTLGNVELYGSCVEMTSPIFHVQTGYLRFMVKNIVPSTTKILIDDGAWFWDGYGYTLANTLALIDTRSAGLFVLSANESATVDLGNYPDTRSRSRTAFRHVVLSAPEPMRTGLSSKRIWRHLRYGPRLSEGRWCRAEWRDE